MLFIDNFQRGVSLLRIHLYLTAFLRKFRNGLTQKIFALRIFMFYEEACSWPELDVIKFSLYMHFEYPFDLGQAQFVIVLQYFYPFPLTFINVNMFLAVTYNNSMLILFKTIIAYMIM
ncbi:hypothetical protein ACJX0J_012768 [Zea mays]